MMQKLITFSFFIILLFIIRQNTPAQDQISGVTPDELMLIRENPGQDERYISAGQKSYIVGMQNGNFPPQGWHIVDEMGGIWIPPLKAADGIWLKNILNVSAGRDDKKITLVLNHTGNYKIEAGIAAPEYSTIQKVLLNNKEFPKENVIERNSLSGKELFIRTDLKHIELEFQLH